MRTSGARGNGLRVRRRCLAAAAPPPKQIQGIAAPPQGREAMAGREKRPPQPFRAKTWCRRNDDTGFAGPGELLHEQIAVPRKEGDPGSRGRETLRRCFAGRSARPGFQKSGRIPRTTQTARRSSRGRDTQRNNRQGTPQLHWPWFSQFPVHVPNQVRPPSHRFRLPSRDALSFIWMHQPVFSLLKFRIVSRFNLKSWMRFLSLWESCSSSISDTLGL